MLRGDITVATIGITLLALSAGPARAVTDPASVPSSYIGSVRVPVTASPPPIDGNIDNPAWKNAAVVQLAYNLRDHKAAPDKTTDYIMSDGTYVYVGVRAQQSGTVRALQHTNDVGVDTDDEVQIDLWPNGTGGFRYLFISTALGTHYQFSSENNSYDPTWWSAGKIVPGGFTVTMKIPLSVMHGSGAGTWHVQFARLVMATNDDLVWSYGPAQQNHNDVNYAGTADGLPQVAALRPAPRAGVYALGAIAGHSAGGNTSRAGVDLSVPVGFGTSFVGTFHPDYSNVEIDQQTIAPTAFPRLFNDVRPFFTQGANFYNTTPNCPDCPGTQLYSLAIPTPRDGYAVEGQHGLFSYAAFDAVGVRRDDNAQVVNYTSPNQQNFITLQRVSANLTDLQDNTVNASYTHDNLKNFSSWIRYSNDQGTNVLAGDRAQRYETGVNWYTPTSSVEVGLRKIGQYYVPVDGLIFQPDIAGYYVNLAKQVKYSSSAPIKEVDFFVDLNRFHGNTGGLSQTNNLLQIGVTTRKLFHVQASTGSSYTLLSNGVFTPITQQGLDLIWNYNSATPTSISFNSGRFGPGRLNSWTRSSTLRAGERGSFTVEADDTDQHTDKGQRFVQWLERASFSYQMSRDSSLALGVRRIIGVPPELDAPQQFVNAWNLSAAFHRKVPGGEVYIVYGDASTLYTVPQFIVKFIKYVGADKGT